MDSFSTSDLRRFGARRVEVRNGTAIALLGYGMSEESVLRYRLEVVRLMPEGAYKDALIEGINASLAALHSSRGSASPKFTVNGNISIP